MPSMTTVFNTDMELTAVVYRADGTVEDLGVIARSVRKRSLWQRFLKCFA